MCGIAGFIDLRRSASHSDLITLACSMASRMTHRGPDDSGEWADPQQGVAFGFRRLSIIDLSPLGHQPMKSESGRYVIVFNGEVYNFLELRAELEGLGVRFRGHSDTEVILAAFTEWGIERSVSGFNGMFAFALWDSELRELWLGRDRIGKKPLHYGWVGQNLLFASEVKALAAHPEFTREIDPGAAALYFRYSYVPAPYCIYRGIRKVAPGTLLRFRDSAAGTSPEVRPYFSLREVAERGQREPYRGTDQEAIEELDRKLRRSVRLRMLSDVPLGAFLSGGIDSSLVVSLMQAQNTTQVKTFTVGFLEDSYNEAGHARAVARHLNTDHTELFVSPAEAMGVVPKIPMLFDEPFGDSSQIPTYLVALLARRHVTVALSGDGGDELFGGYNRYLWASSSTGFAAPLQARKVVAALMSRVPVRMWDSLYSVLRPAIPKARRFASAGDKMHKVARTLRSPSVDQAYQELVSYWDPALNMVTGAAELPVNLTSPSTWAELASPPNRMMFLDMISYLPDEILVKVDRATMAVSLEGRAPFLDPDVVEFAWSLPLRMKIRDGQGKWLVRQVLDRYVPRPLLERPKMGFGIPLGEWLRGPLREWADQLISSDRLADAGLLRPEPIRQRWADHLNGRGSWQHHLWIALMYLAWVEQQSETASCLEPAAATTRR